MNVHDNNCRVASASKCNHATKQFDNATDTATNAATLDLLTLSARILAKHKNNSTCNSHAIKQHSEGASKHSSVQHNNASGYLRKLIIQVSQKHGGDDEQFLEEYINDVMKQWSHDLNVAIVCFEGLAQQNISVINRE